MMFISHFYQIDRLRRHSNLLQLRRFTGFHAELDTHGKQELVDICRHFYRHGLRLSRSQVHTLNKPCDFYIILASHIKIELYQETGTYACGLVPNSLPVSVACS